jgi:hypothetical protein
MPRKKKNPLKQVGTTPEGKKVYKGLYKFYETYGLPLDVILTVFQSKDWVPDWIDFYIGAIAAGMEHDRIISKLEADISDSFGKIHADAVILRLNEIFKAAPEKINQPKV